MRAIARLLEKRKLADDTLVIFLADNGWIQDPKPIGPHRARNNRPTTAGCGRRSWCAGRARPPRELRHPRQRDRHRTHDPQSGRDLTRKPERDGVNLLDEQAVSSRPAIFGEIFTHNAVDIHDPSSSLRYRWVVAGDWKLIVPDRRNEPNGVVLLVRPGA